MNKKTYTIIGVAALLLVAGSLALVVQHNHKTTVQMARCVEKDDSPNLKVPSAEQNNIVNAAIAHIVNVPAGTQVDINLKSYTGTTAVGSSIYNGSYGSYNFTAKKKTTIWQGVKHVDWAITSFVACKR